MMILSNRYAPRTSPSQRDFRYIQCIFILQLISEKSIYLAISLQIALRERLLLLYQLKKLSLVILGRAFHP